MRKRHRKPTAFQPFRIPSIPNRRHLLYDSYARGILNPSSTENPMTESITVSKEDYLKAILEAESEGHHVIPATLAHWLSVSAPAVTMALKRLKRDGFVEVKPDGIVRLTASGKETAYRTALRHHLIERMLAEVFGMEWYEIHAEAERLEHAVSPAFEARLIQKLGEQGTCPHGNTVLPESPTQRRKRGLIQLSEGAENTDYMVTSLYERDPKLLVFLYQSGISPNTRVRLLAKNYDQTVSIENPLGTITLGRPAAERVWVKRLTPKDSGKDSIK
jgi:DtxR family Mn-dependent transcriptional regulator